MSMRPSHQSGIRFCVLLGIALAVGISVPITAYVGSLFGDTYNQRVMIYGGQLLWLVAGSFCVAFITRGAVERPANFGFLLLCFISVWLWPLVLLMWLAKRTRQ